jgi:hypothetical protein
MPPNTTSYIVVINYHAARFEKNENFIVKWEKFSLVTPRRDVAGVLGRILDVY